MKTKSKSEQFVYPKGWDAKRVQAVIAHYENQPEDQMVAADEAAFGKGRTTSIQIRPELVPTIEMIVGLLEQTLGKTKPKAKSKSQSKKRKVA